MSSTPTHGTARRIIDGLKSYGVKIPAPVAAAMKAIEETEALQPEKGAQQDLIRAYEERNREAIPELIVKAATFGLAAQAWTAARVNLGQEALDLIEAHGTTLIEALASVAQPMIDELNATAALDSLDTGQLMRAGRTADAEKASRFDMLAAQIVALHKLRDSVVRRNSSWSRQVRYDARTWRNTLGTQGNFAELGTAIEKMHSPDGVYILRGIRHGGNLWWPTPKQSREASDALEAARREKAAA